MKMKFVLSFFGLALIAFFAFSPLLFNGPAMASGTSSFSSPAAQQNYQNFGDINSDIDSKSFASSLKQSDFKQKQIAQRSSGCSVGCSTGCSTGCSNGCSVGCSVGCSRGCSKGCD